MISTLVVQHLLEVPEHVPASPLSRSGLRRNRPSRQGGIPEGRKLEAILEDGNFAHLFPRVDNRLWLRGVWLWSPSRSSRGVLRSAGRQRRARARIAWKYALSLELAYSGFDASVLCKFWSRLLAGEAKRLFCDHLLHQYREMGLVKVRGKWRTDPTRILAAVRVLNHLELGGGTMRHILGILSTVASEWIRERVHEEWTQRCLRRLDDEKSPKSKDIRIQEGEKIGADARELLDEILSEARPAGCAEPGDGDFAARMDPGSFHDQNRDARWPQGRHQTLAVRPADGWIRRCVKNSPTVSRMTESRHLYRASSLMSQRADGLHPPRVTFQRVGKRLLD